MARKEVDWEGIEADYRAGVLSLRVIGKKFDVSDTAIRKKAAAEGWERALADKVRDAVEEGLVRAEVRTGHAQPEHCEPANLRTTPARPAKPADPARDREIIQAAAATGIAVVQAHRQDIANSRGIVGMLLGELRQTTQAIDAIEDTIVADTADDPNTQRRAQMLKAVSLPTRAATVRDLSTALKNLVAIERQAFGLDKPEDEKGKKAAPALHIHKHVKPASPAPTEENEE